MSSIDDIEAGTPSLCKEDRPCNLLTNWTPAEGGCQLVPPCDEAIISQRESMEHVGSTRKYPFIKARVRRAQLDFSQPS